MQQIPVSHLPTFPDIIIWSPFLVLLLFQCLHYVRKVSWANTERARESGTRVCLNEIDKKYVLDRGNQQTEKYFTNTMYHWFQYDFSLEMWQLQQDIMDKRWCPCMWWWLNITCLVCTSKDCCSGGKCVGTQPNCLAPCEECCNDACRVKSGYCEIFERGRKTCFINGGSRPKRPCQVMLLRDVNFLKSPCYYIRPLPSLNRTSKTQFSTIMSPTNFLLKSLASMYRVEK